MSLGGVPSLEMRWSTCVAPTAERFTPGTGVPSPVTVAGGRLPAADERDGEPAERHDDSACEDHERRPERGRLAVRGAELRERLGARPAASPARSGVVVTERLLHRASLRDWFVTGVAGIVAGPALGLAAEFAGPAALSG